jgi:hypothetical protein
MTFYSTKEGKFLNRIYCHKNVIANSFIDIKNKLVISACWGGKIMIQKGATENKLLYRVQKNSHYGKPISIMRV